MKNSNRAKINVMQWVLRSMIATFDGEEVPDKIRDSALFVADWLESGGCDLSLIGNEVVARFLDNGDDLR